MTSTALARAKDTARRPGLRRGPAAGIEVVPGTAGDHPAVQQFLLSVFSESSSADFQAQLDEPTYEPSDRLLVKHGPCVAAHLRLMSRQMQFGAAILPISYIADVATAPEFRGRGYASALLEAAERRIFHETSVLGLLQTAAPDFYRRRGWVVCGRHSCSTAGCHQVLAHLRAQEIPRAGSLATAWQPPLHIRYLRRVELAAVIRLHAEHVRQAYGGFGRTETYWKWLINRRGYDRIYVAIEGSPEIELDGTFSAIVGYAAAKNARLVELVSAARRPDAAPRLLARFCSDAIEQDLREIRVELAPDHLIHHALLAAGGSFCRQELDRGHAFMVKVLDFERLVRALHAEFLSRLGSAGRFSHRELGFVVGDQQWVLQISPSGSRLVAGRVGRKFLRCSWPQFGQLLLGHLDVRQAVRNGVLIASNRLAVESAGVLFPQVPLWYPPLDDLPTK